MAEETEVEKEESLLNEVLSERAGQVAESSSPALGKEPGEPEPTKPESEASPEKPVADDKPKDKAPVAGDIEKLRKDLETYEKRFRDTQSNWNTEHQKRLDLEKKLVEIEAKLAKKGDGLGFFTDDDGEKAPVVSDATAKKIDAVYSELQELKRREVLREWDAAEKPVKAANKDYDTVVFEIFQPQYEQNPALKQEFLDKGSTPAAAYEIGKRLQEQAEILKDPKAWRAKVEEELKTKLKNPEPSKEPRARMLDDVVPAKPAGNAGDFEGGNSVLDEVLNSRERRRK